MNTFDSSAPLLHIADGVATITLNRPAQRNRLENSDLALLAESGATVAHSPVAIGRRGTALETFARYKGMGVNLALGTDSYPLDMLSEMRWAVALGRSVAGDGAATTARDAFDAATLAGARALRRDDLGRLSAGAQADFLVMRADDARFGTARDPFEAIVQLATPRQIREVHKGGKLVVQGGVVCAWREHDILGEARIAAQASPRRLSTWSSMPWDTWKRDTSGSGEAACSFLKVSSLQPTKPSGGFFLTILRSFFTSPAALASILTFSMMCSGA